MGLPLKPNFIFFVLVFRRDKRIVFKNE